LLRLFSQIFIGLHSHSCADIENNTVPDRFQEVLRLFKSVGFPSWIIDI
jgi:hypothetical protein